jgi:hypothetical protein
LIIKPASLSEVTVMNLITSANLGEKRNIVGTNMGGHDRINRQWTLANLAGKTIYTKNGTALNMRVVVGQEIRGLGLAGVQFIGLHPSETYMLTVEPKNPDGSPSGVRMPIDFHVDVNNVG